MSTRYKQPHGIGNAIEASEKEGANNTNIG
jgi:hypothetical protein